MSLLSSITTETRDALILDFDTEARPIAWYGGDFVTKQPTAIAWKFIGHKRRPYVRAIGESYDTRKVLDEERFMIEEFREAYNVADIVTAHFIRGYDLKTITAACIRLGLEPLAPKMTLCTKEDLVKASGISKSMENLSAMFGTDTQKYTMNTAKWADANMLLPKGIAWTKKRVVTDVIEHIELFQLMQERRLMTTPSLWTPESSGGGGMYHA